MKTGEKYTFILSEREAGIVLAALEFVLKLWGLVPFKDEKSDLYGFAYADISTGEFKITQAPLNMVLSELARISPVEIVAPAVNQKIMPFQIVPEQKIDLPDNIGSVVQVENQRIKQN